MLRTRGKKAERDRAARTHVHGLRGAVAEWRRVAIQPGDDREELHRACVGLLLRRSGLVGRNVIIDAHVHHVVHLGFDLWREGGELGRRLNCSTRAAAPVHWEREGERGACRPMD